MAEPPIGNLNPQATTFEPAMLTMVVFTVLDGGTGFLKVGYAAQVRPTQDPTYACVIFAG